jgi:hypothetical protein
MPIPPSKSYRRVMLGKKSMYAAEYFAGNFIGADFGLNEDLTGHLPDSWRDFNKEYVPKWMALHPGKSKISAGLSCGALWVVGKGLKPGGALQKAGRDRSLEALEGLKCSESPIEPSHLSDHLLGFHQIVDLDLDGLRRGGLNNTP